ncbi:GNAT family N-acetyltransferase [Nocardioides sp. zg-536]|uniref:GNAT family N-acetyltransferase n=1 Tax=Nocardioides faecalis TaxID=2803858 RepID=A0A938YCH0_9ACTN|nr:GNAT family N-acetyltransferase [Nocardioides faecalis]MBM9461314.1 GNAT family N-acetyltransferase [Nocardioides faecalis]MBS4752380.1 GNAT family N-acetyltransferase [Nocardioides faecalis]QVI57675.1 GNAT family N-acetyltransferase [Nocardioides faecalis]
MLTTRQGVRVLASADLPEFLALAGQDPVVNVFAVHRAQTTRLEPRWLGGEMWGRFEDGEMVAACHAAANLVPVQATVEDARAFAERALARRRTFSTVVGPQAAVGALWNEVRGQWGEPRDVRWDQRHLAIDTAPSVAPDPGVRVGVRDDLPTLYPACVAMYTEEVGVSPESGGAGDLYRARVAQLVGRAWSFVRYDGDELVFKAEVACATAHAAQIQGVWVPPHRRGQGLATTGMAAVVQQVRARLAPTVSLYVNDWNHSARAAYARVGFTETARFATIMY